MSNGDVLKLAQRDLACYCHAMNPKYDRPRHLDILIDFLMAVEAGDIDRGMVFMPPRNSKSFTTSEFFPAWFLGRHPELNVVGTSYGQTLANKFGRSVKTQMLNPLYQQIFTDTRLAQDSRAVNRFDTTKGGGYYGVGRGGGLTGRGADLLIIDDPLKDMQEADSETIRETMKDWWRSVLYTRLQPGAKVIVVQTRWHEDDMAGFLLDPDQQEEVDDWVQVNLPAVAGDDDPFRQKGEPLWPERYDLPELKRIERNVGPRVWQALYQQSPTGAEGVILKREYFENYYRFDPELLAEARSGTRTLREAQAENPKFNVIPNLIRVFMSVDSAVKEEQENDYSAIGVYAVTTIGILKLYGWRGKVDLYTLKQTTERLAGKWKPSAIYIEDKSSGQQLIQELRRKSLLPYVACLPDGDKVFRAHAIQPVLAAKRFLMPLPEFAPWSHDFVEECAVFPRGKNDDQVDEFTQALGRVLHGPEHDLIIHGSGIEQPDDGVISSIFER